MGEARAFVKKELGLDYDLAPETLQAAIEQLEAQTGWRPYKAETQTRRFNPPGSPPRAGILSGGGTLLELRGGLLSASSVTIEGTVKTQGTDYWLEGQMGDTFTLMRFSFPIFGRPQSLVITGSWGREEVPCSSAKRAVLCLIGEEVSKLVASRHPGMSGWKDGDIAEDYGFELTTQAGLALASQAKSLMAGLTNRAVF